MNIYQKWTIQLTNNISGGGVMPPTIDTVDKSTFYVSDGWGTAYAAIRFRKFSIETGEELANILVRNCARCIYVNNEYVFAILDKRIIKLNRNDLSMECVYKNNIPRYADYVSSDDSNTLLLMNHYKGYLHCYNLQTEKSSKKKVGGGCGIVRVDADNFLIFNYDAILQYSLKANIIKTLVSTEHYTSCARGNSGKVYLLCEKPIKNTDAEGNVTPYSSKILMYSFRTESTVEEIIPGKVFNEFCLSEDESLLYLIKNNILWVYSIFEKEIIFSHTFQDKYIFNIFTEKGIVITYNESEQELTCWKMEI